MPVNLLGLPVATQQTTQDPHAAHPGQLLRHTGVGCTLSLTWERFGRQVNTIVHTDLHYPGGKMSNKLLNTSKQFCALIKTKPLQLVRCLYIQRSVTLLSEGRCGGVNLPTPMCLPLRRASVFLRHRAREWTVTGLRMIRPSFTSLRICWPERRTQTSERRRRTKTEQHHAHEYTTNGPENDNKAFAPPLHTANTIVNMLTCSFLRNHN